MTACPSVLRVIGVARSLLPAGAWGTAESRLRVLEVIHRR